VCQVGYLPQLYEDARSEKYLKKKGGTGKLTGSRSLYSWYSTAVFGLAVNKEMDE